MNTSSDDLVIGADLPESRLDEGARSHGLLGKMQALKDPIRTLSRKVEFGDVLLFFYFLVLMRQCFWVVSNNTLAWALTISVSLSLACFALSKKERPLPGERLSYSFYLIVALPLLVVYANRFVFPDLAFDVLSYHILVAERSLIGWPTTPPDYFPLNTLNPLPDMLTGIYRHVLGYRVGTIVNYLTLIWVAVILVKLLRSYLKRTWLIYLAVSLIILTETLLFELSNYMVDLLGLPLLLQATYLALYVKPPKTIGPTQFFTAFLLGLSVTVKLTSVFFVIPIGLVWAWRLFAARIKLKPLPLLFLVLVSFGSLIPHGIHLHREGIPVVPFSTLVLKSPLAFTKLKDKRWGPKQLEDAFIWPAVLYFKTNRISELTVYAGRIPLGFVLAFFFLPFKRIDRNIRALSFIMIVGALIWSLTSGYTRYAGYLEIVSGVLVIYLSCLIAAISFIPSSLKRIFSSFPWIFLAVSSAYSVSYIDYDWSLRPNGFQSRSRYLRDSRLLFRDHSLKSFLTPEKLALFNEVGVWMKFDSQVGSIEGLLKPDIPGVSLRLLGFETKEQRDASFRIIRDAGTNRRMFSLCNVKDLQPALEFMAQRGLRIGKITTLTVPYFSYHTIYSLALIEVLAPGDSASGTGTILSTADGPLPDAAYQASITSESPPASLVAGSMEPIYLTVKNTSTVVWPALGQQDGRFRVNLGNHWLDSKGEMLIPDNGRTGLPLDLKPGDETELTLTITAPNVAGDYILEIDMVQEHVAWFGRMGSKTLRVSVKVE